MDKSKRLRLKLFVFCVVPYDTVQNLATQFNSYLHFSQHEINAVMSLQKNGKLDWPSSALAMLTIRYKQSCRLAEVVSIPCISQNSEFYLSVYCPPPPNLTFMATLQMFSLLLGGTYQKYSAILDY